MLDAVLCWIESHPGVATWVQAGGTFIALAIAIGVPWWIHKGEAEERAVERRNQGRGVALLISQPLFNLDSDMEQVILGVEFINFSDMVVEIPQAIKVEVGRLWLMGGVAASNTQHLVSQIEAHNGFITSSVIRWSRYTPQDRETFTQMAVRRLELARESVQSARAGMAGLLADDS